MEKIVNIGYRQSLYWGDETGYGSAAAINEPVGLVQSVNPTETNSLMKIRTLGGSRDYSNIVPGKFEVTGSFEYYLQGGAFLRQCMGEDTSSTATTDSGPSVHTGASYVHVMGSAASPESDNFPSFTLEFTDEEDTEANSMKRLYDGCRVNSATISASVDEAVKVAVDFQAQGVHVSTADASSVSESTDDPYVFYQGAVYSTSGAISYQTVVESDSQLAEVNSLDFSVNNNLEAIWYISGTTAATQTIRGLKQLIAKGRDYEASLGLHFANKTMYQKFLGSGTATEDQATLADYTIVVDFVRSGVIGSAKKLATDDYIRIVMDDCKFNDINIAGAPEDVIAQNISVFVESAKVYVVDADATYKHA